MVSGELAGECLQTGFERHGLPPHQAPLDTVYPLREHRNNVQRMVSGGYCEGLFPDMVSWTRLRNTWIDSYLHIPLVNPLVFTLPLQEVALSSNPRNSSGSLGRGRGGKTYRRAKSRDGPLETIFGDPPKLLLRRSPKGNSEGTL